MKYLLIIWVMSNGHDHTAMIPVRSLNKCRKEIKNISFGKDFEKASFYCVKIEWNQEKLK